MQSRPTGLVIENLTVQDGCVWIVTTHARYLGLWPSNFRMAADGAGFTVRGDGVEVSSGHTITVGGKEYAGAARLRRGAHRPARSGQLPRRRLARHHDPARASLTPEP
jgi:hypothetical protein